MRLKMTKKEAIIAVVSIIVIAVGVFVFLQMKDNADNANNTENTYIPEQTTDNESDNEVSTEENDTESDTEDSEPLTQENATPEQGNIVNDSEIPSGFVDRLNESTRNKE